mgnify:CR=1 FL=1
MKIQTTILGEPWTIRNDHPFWPPLLAAATTIGQTTVFDSGLCPDSVALAHEWYHVAHTSWLRYVLSFTVGRLWGDDYWRHEESEANLSGQLHRFEPAFVALAAQIRAQIPASIPTVSINHPV